MPAYPPTNALLDDIRGLKQGQTRSDTRSHQNPDDVPLAPLNVNIDFRVREKQNRIDYDAIVSSDGVTPNTCAADIGEYVYQMKAVKQNGDPIPQNQLDSGEEIKWSHIVVRKDASDMTTPHAVFDRVPNPKEWYYIARARVIDRIGHLGDWSPWTAPVKPVQEADPVPPTPTGIAMNFDRVEKDRHHRYRCIATCNEITNWDIPGGDDEGDIDRYEFELRKSDDVGTPDSEAGRRHTVHQSADGNGIAKTIFFPVRKTLYYVLRVRAIDRFNRHGAWSAWVGPGTVADTTPPPVPTTVIVEGLFNRVAIDWAAPLDVAGDPDEDVLYFQAQRSTDRNFDNIVGKTMYIVETRKSWDTRAYKQRFWMRVRSVDASGNKSAWVQAGPVSPQKATASRQVVVASGPIPSDIDWRTEDGIDLAGEITNRAYNVSGTNGVNLTAWVDGEFPFGTIVSDVQFSPTTGRTRIGVIFHYIDANNYMYVAIEHTGSPLSSVTRLRKVSGGVDTSLASTTTQQYVDGQGYQLRVYIAATTIRVEVDNFTAISFGISGADQTQYNAADIVGLYKRRGNTSDDDGGSRHESFSYTSDTGEVVVDDDFDRLASVSSLGTAPSGQGWTSQVGVWGIIDESVPTAIYGYGVTIPILYMEDATERNGIAIEGTTSGGTTLMGQTGLGINPLTFDIDRPTRIIMLAWANFMNESASDLNFSMFAAVQDMDGVYSYGRATKSFGAANDSTGIHRRIIATSRQMFIDPGSDPGTIKIWFGYRQSTGGSKSHTISNQKMLIILSYAPDFDPSTPNERVAWTKSASLASAYRQVENSD